MLKELIVPAKSLPIVRQISGTQNQLGSMLKSSGWNDQQLPDAAILGITDPRLSDIGSYAESPDAIREQLYQLNGFPGSFKLVDLGNVKEGKEVTDTIAAVQVIAEEMFTMGIPLLILGGSQGFTVPLLAGMEKKELVLTIVDDRLDLSEPTDSLHDNQFMNALSTETIVHGMAIQSFFVAPERKESFSDEFNGTLFTLGEIRNGIELMEPYLRETDLTSFDYGSLRLCEAPGQGRNSPNGLTGEEACQLAWYAGISTNPGWFALFGYQPAKDPERHGAMMAAQIAWYFLYGRSKRIDEVPQDEALDFLHFVVPVEGIPEPVTFLKHPASKRWWMEVPSPDCDLFPLRIPCSKKDYRQACKNEIPERWWSSFNKSY